MRLIDFNFNPTDRQLRQFGLACLLMLGLMAWFWRASVPWATAFSAVAVVLVLVTAIGPRLLKPVFIAAAVVTTPLGMVIGELAMLLIFCAVFLPIGLVFRLLRRDALRRRIEPEAESYWEPKKRPKSIASYYRQS